MKYFTKIIIISLLFLFNLNPAFSSNIEKRLSGRILIQVEKNGEAWYLNPENNFRYFLGRPADAFSLMRELGLGINENNYNIFKNQGASHLAGRILLRVEANGEAYYVNPLDNKLYFLNRPADAFQIMRNFGLGITNNDLYQISEYKLGHKVSYNWRYQNNNYNLDYYFDTDVYNLYKNDPKVYSYSSDNIPDDLRDSYYSMFLKRNELDNDSIGLLYKLKEKAEKNSFFGDEKIEFIVSFIQHINYDTEKAKSDYPIANFPFETLYLNRGVCTDTSFLAVYWLRYLGYGTAILDFPDSFHSALGIECEVSYSINDSGFCYVETTNYFPFGIVPASLSQGQAIVSEDKINDSFSVDNLGKLEIRQKQTGLKYYSISDNKEVLNKIVDYRDKIEISKQNLDSKKNELDKLYEDIIIKEEEALVYLNENKTNLYNIAIGEYNKLVLDYNLLVDEYKILENHHNKLIISYNNKLSNFYQLEF